MALSDEDRGVYMARLRAAETAYDALMIQGQVRVYVDQNGERLEYNAVNANRLKAYIMELKVALGLNLGITGPMDVWVI